MGDFLPLLGDWFWFAVAGVLLILELALPGVFFIWLAVAAVVVGALDLGLNLPWQMELVLFALLSLATVFAGRKFLNRRHVLDSTQPNLNQRMYDYIGKTYSLAEPMIDGRGRVSIDGTQWDVCGPDLPAGSKIKVTGVDGLKLTVERS